jgi:hypothetical protein
LAYTNAIIALFRIVNGPGEVVIAYFKNRFLYQDDREPGGSVADSIGGGFNLNRFVGILFSKLSIPRSGNKLPRVRPGSDRLTYLKKKTNAGSSFSKGVNEMTLILRASVRDNRSLCNLTDKISLGFVYSINAMPDPLVGAGGVAINA